MFKLIARLWSKCAGSTRRNWPRQYLAGPRLEALWGSHESLQTRQDSPRLRLDVLEARVCPADFLSFTGAVNGLWSVAGNWSVTGNPNAHHSPTADDSVFLPGNLNSMMDGDFTVKSVSIIQARANAPVGTFTIKGTLTVSGTLDLGKGRNSSGTVVATTTTNGTGFYTFSAIAAGSFSIQFVIPSLDTGAGFTTERVGSDDTINSSANSSGYTSAFTLAAGQTWLDENVGLTGIPV